MEGARVSSVVYNRRSCIVASKITRHGVVAQEKSNLYDPDNADDGYVSNKKVFLLLYQMRFWLGFAMMLFLTILWVALLVLMIPWPLKRIKISNAWGYVNGRLLFWMVGNPVKIEGLKHTQRRAIFISNHASAVDVLLIMQLVPWGTVGIAKKEIVWYPLFGQIYWLANHLRIDRSSTSAAIASLKQVASVVAKNKLSLAIFPEGTRSEDGKLLPFKKDSRSFPLSSSMHISCGRRVKSVCDRGLWLSRFFLLSTPMVGTMIISMRIWNLYVICLSNTSHCPNGIVLKINRG